MKADFWCKVPLWQAEGGGSAAAADDQAAADAAAAAGAAAGGDGAAPAGSSAKWWEGSKFSDDHRKHLTASGLTVDDPLDALARVTDMHRHAMQRLGKDPSTFLDKPAKDQALTDWMKKNRDVFGLPENAEGYKITAPENWPKDAPWDKDFEAEARAFAFENGLPPDAVQGMVGLYAKKVMAMNGAAEAELAAANERMRGDLAKDWGSQTDARLLRASQAAQIIAEKAGMSADQLAEAAKTLSLKVGDANVIRMFDVMAASIGDDRLMGAGAGSGTFGTTPAEARQQLAQLRGPGGAYYLAVSEGNSSKIAELKPQIDRLTKIAAGG